MGRRGPIDRAQGGAKVPHCHPTPYYLSPGQGGDHSGLYAPCLLLASLGRAFCGFIKKCQ
jgi:hypothetical protein